MLPGKSILLDVIMLYFYKNINSHASLLSDWQLSDFRGWIWTIEILCSSWLLAILARSNTLFCSYRAFDCSRLSCSYMYMCKSSEICDETLNVVLKIFFQAHLRGQVFLVVCSIYKKNSWLKGSIKWYTFSRTTSYFLRKWQKSPSL